MARISLAFIIVITMLCTAGCFNSKSNSLTQLDAQQQPTIILRMPYSYSEIELPPGDVGDDNFISRYILKKTGIQVQYSWEASGEENYNSKLELAIRSNDLPDAFIVNRNQLIELANQQLIEPMEQYYEQYSSELVKSIYDATEGQALAEATINERLYGLPNVGIEADGPTYLWVRQDWLEKLKLKAPRTLDDIAAISLAFQQLDPDGNNEHDTLGIPVDKSLVYQHKTGIYGLNSVFASFHSFPQNWIVSSNGHLVYGSIQQETKEALALLAQWYDKGVIDRDFMLRKEESTLISQNKTGIIFAPWWAPFWPLSSSVSLDTKAEWKVYMAPLQANGQFVTKQSPITDRYLVVRKGYAHPEAAVELVNLFTALERYEEEKDDDSEHIRSVAAQQGVQLRNFLPFDLLLDDPKGVQNRYETLQRLISGEVSEEDVIPEIRNLYRYTVLEAEQPKKSMEAWSTTQAYLQGGEISKKNKVIVENFNIEHLPTYNQYKDILLELEMDYFLKIIIGELEIDSFDLFVEQWLDSGGLELLREASFAYEREKS